MKNSPFVFLIICIIIHNSRGSNEANKPATKVYKHKFNRNPRMNFDDFGNRAVPSRNYPMQSPPHPTGGVGATGGSTGGDGSPLSWGNLNRQLNSLTAGSLQPASSSAEYSLSAPADNAVAAGGHGWGWGKGWGWGHGHGHKAQVNDSAVGLLGFLALLSLIQGKDCNSALGLLGVLGLAAYLQNVLTQLQAAAAAPPAGRKKRSVKGENLYQSGHVAASHIELTQKLFPLLMAVGNARAGSVPLHCTLRPVCLANEILNKELGTHAYIVTSQLNTAVSNMLSQVDNSKLIKKGVKQAAKIGRKGKQGQCEKSYPYCPEAEKSSSYASLPLMMLG